MEQRERTPRITQTSFYILASLAYGRKHGYAIVKDVEKLSRGDVRLAIGNLYVALKRLLDDGLVIQVERTPTGRVRIIYELTDKGADLLNAQTEQIERMLDAVPRLRLAGQHI